MITLYNENDVRIRDIRIYEINDADMGESTITASVKFDQVMQFHPDWYVLVDGEKYKLGVTEPSGKRSTTQINVEYSLTFHSSREDLKRYTFMDFVEYGSGNPQPSQHTFSVQACTLAQFVSKFNTNLRYYLGSIWTMELSDDADPSIVANLTFDRASIWDVLLNVYSNYGVRWTIRNDNGIMSIIVGKDATELQTIFEYGNGNGLISVERTNPMERIVTRLRGKGGERNLPANYFHAATDAYPIGDPDTNTVLQGIYYNRLYPKCYRDYVRGYNSGESRTDESWAYQQGVADKIAGKPMNIVDFAKSDKEGLWGISYGAIEDNDAIYPTLQGTTRDGVELDKVLAVSPIYVDAPDDGAASRQFTQVNGDKGSFQGRDIWLRFNRNQDGGIYTVEGISNAKSATADSETFTLETSINTVRAKFLVTPTKVADRYASAFGVTDPVSPTLTTVVEMAADNWNFVERLQLINATTGDVVRTWSGDNQDFFDVEADDIPAGTYKFRSYIQWYKTTGTTPDKLLYTIDWQLYGCEYAVYDSELARQSYSDTFDIWIGNVWNTTKRADETDEDYAFRVWSPLVSKDEMAVMFSDGLLAGEDYEFPIVGAVAEAENLEEIIKKAIHYDTSVTGSHWRLSLKKSDAEFEASGKYLPNSVVNAVAGNHFFFINILMPYDPYVYDAERRQQEYLEEQLSLLDVELPTFAVVPSSVFMASFAEAGDVRPGNKIRLFDASLIGSSYTTVYIQSVTKRYTANKINPDWSLVVSDQIVVGGNPITLIDGKVEALSRQMYSSKQATRDAIEAMSQFYLRKDGLADTSFSPTDFRAPVTLRDRLLDYNFRQGDLGGYGFGVYTDPEGHRVVEADVLVGRMALRVNEIVVNQVDYVGGQRIYSAAAMTVSRLEETESIWRCYFDNKQGTVQNLFLVGDLAFCQRFKGTEEGGYTTYWSKVTAIGSDYIELSKTDIMSAGSGTPAVGDNIIQLGNVSDKDRQSAIIMSSYGANSPSLRLYHGIDGYSLNNKDVFGVEYDSVNQIPYFYNYGSMRLGARTDAEGGFITYNHISKQLNIKAVVNFLPQSTGLEQMEAYQKLVQIAQGNIETWFHDDVTPAQTGAPTLTNYPVNSWEAVDYENHVGDIYYSDTGKGYRFKRNGNSWAWEIISDAELAQIMAEVQNLQYLKTALGQDTTVAGGLILTSLIQLGYKDAQDVRHTMAGISGLGQNDRGIAAWFGGPMVDHELTPTATDYAKSLFRFDGTGYLAKGNITWDANGYGQIGGSGNNYAVKWDANGVRLGNGVYIGSDSNKTLGTILTLLNKFDSWFGYDETNKAIYIKKQTINGVETDINFYTFGDSVAGGPGSGGGGGVNYLYMLEDVPDYRTSYRGKYLRAKSDGSGVEWVDVTGGVSSVISLTGNITQSQLRTALGLGSAAYTDSSAYATATQGSHGETAHGWGNHARAGYLTGITSSMVTSALGYTPYNASNPNGYISGISKAMVENVLTGDITSHTHSFASLTSKPTTIAGYGITDAYTKAEVNSALSGYLPLSGGTMTGNITWNTDSHGIYFLSGCGIEKWEGYNPALVAEGDNTNFYIRNGTNRNEYYKIIHSGNYNSYAPTLTGTGASGTWGINISGNAATATNADMLDGYDITSIMSTRWANDIKDLNEISIPSIWRLSRLEPNLPSHIFDYGNLLHIMVPGADTAWQLIGSYSSDNLWFRRGTWYSDGGGNLRTNAWKQIAFIDSNVASATQLQTSRTIWGQSFNGTGDVSGALRGVTTISASGTITSSDGDFLRSTFGSYGTIFESYRGRLYVLFTNKDDQTGENNSLRPLIIEQSNGNVYLATATEKVGIGTEAPSEKLHVIGNILATGEVTAGNSSDSRFKDNQISLRNADRVLKSLRPMEFDWNELYHSLGGRNEGHDVGFLAQDVQPLIPSAIGKVYGDYLRLDYNKVTPYLVAGWQSHETRIQQLERENKELKMEIQRLRN